MFFPQIGGMEILGWLWQFGAQAPATGTSSSFSWPAGPLAASAGALRALLQPGAGGTFLHLYLSSATGDSWARPNRWHLFACWPEELLSVSSSPSCLFLFAFSLFGVSPPPFLFCSFALLLVHLLFLSSLLRFSFLFCYFSSSFPLSCSRSTPPFAFVTFASAFLISLFLSAAPAALPRAAPTLPSRCSQG